MIPYHEWILEGPAVEAGVAAGCVFCLARKEPHPQPGTVIRFLAGDTYNTGRTGTVDARPGWDINEFLVQFGGDPPGNTYRVNKKWGLYQTPPSPPIPEWAPPLSVEDAANLDQVVVRFCNAGHAQDWNLGGMKEVLSLIERIWVLRLPLDTDELWNQLAAHGCLGRIQKKLLQRVAEGRDLLVFVQGRKPIKKKRMEPLSKWKA